MVKSQISQPIATKLGSRCNQPAKSVNPGPWLSFAGSDRPAGDRTLRFFDC